MESLFSKYDRLYVYSVDANGEVKEKVLKQHIRCWDRVPCWKDEKGQVMSVKWSDIDEFKNNRVVLTSEGVEYAKEIITKGLFKKMLKAQEAYNRANEKYIKFRKANN